MKNISTHPYQNFKTQQKNAEFAFSRSENESLTRLVRNFVEQTEQGQPFTITQVLAYINTHFKKIHSVERSTISKSLSYLVKSELIDRVTRGVFVKPKVNRFIGRVSPTVEEVVRVISQERNEIIQTHGAEAVRQFKLSTQMPMQPIYYTSGRSRQIKTGNLTIRLVHTSNKSKLQHPGEKLGIALSALWYMGKKNTNIETVRQIHNALSTEEFEQLCQSNMPKWMSTKLNQYIRYS